MLKPPACLESFLVVELPHSAVCSFLPVHCSRFGGLTVTWQMRWNCLTKQRFLTSHSQLQMCWLARSYMTADTTGCFAGGRFLPIDNVVGFADWCVYVAWVHAVRTSCLSVQSVVLSLFVQHIPCETLSSVSLRAVSLVTPLCVAALMCLSVQSVCQVCLCSPCVNSSLCSGICRADTHTCRHSTLTAQTDTAGQSH